jgi:hypothetical protein
MIVSRAAGRDAATRQRIAVAALARSTPATRLARRYGTRRKFIGVVPEKARHAVEQAFVVPPEMSPEFEAFARVSQAWVRRFVLATVLVAHAAYWTATAARWRPLWAASVWPRPRPASGRRPPGHGRHLARELAGREPELTTAQILLLAPPFSCWPDVRPRQGRSRPFHLTFVSSRTTAPARANRARLCSPRTRHSEPRRLS